MDNNHDYKNLPNDKTSTRERIIALKEIFEKMQYQKLGISMEEIQAELSNNYEMDPNRKTLYKDIEMINEMFEFCIEYDNKLKKYVNKDKRKLKIEDIEIITNALISSRFISKEDTRDIINRFHNKLGYKKQNIIGLDHRVKHHNDELYEVITLIDKAIKENLKIKFDYYKLDSDMKPYCAMCNCIVNPLAHVWYEDLYFLLGNYKDQKISHYRIDRIKNIEITAEKRKPIYQIIGKHDDFNISEYVSKLAGMSSGNETIIEVRVKKEVLGKVYDRFGNRMRLIEICNDWTLLHITVIHNKDLIRWILMLGDGIEVIHPINIRMNLISAIENINLLYKKNK
jgi:predicted DNA-binding transcriptional regulator YafY